ncbi:unknown [Odoribacter sp. CAG:788]|jgi:hypothetical protein|nr:unknown [Odoribacter sp. CAG:788]
MNLSLSGAIKYVYIYGKAGGAEDARISLFLLFKWLMIHFSW